MNDKNQNLSEKTSVHNQNILEKAFSFYSRKDFEKAEYFFALALEEHENAKNYFFRGKCFMNLKQPLAAISCFEKARELAPKNIRVNAVAPGIIETDMVANLPKEVIEPLIKTIPLGRIGKPSDIANAFLFLASDLSSYITGEILQVDGAARS
jgi:tetratricopeptide (TPR) repeat protein